eukprot:CAMPEP_0183298078 /NCGR_PEP_ID=MMETSP0160_2-20130417/5199_1 /TAXON_ID=2839 ORGANISM="Odontella Sinensis, Strain Grunow 1884" /NCGR_SAMPLE_ID=MMETSP0160_2 /ASSEMBLY_ACC=CAM_ASM_000250 /LENGTH=294 /DNA_ID=CAMNT_0025460029 /DNA_START=162 /DNA_END=1046 /DNA_ORIENTATION=+
MFLHKIALSLFLPPALGLSPFKLPFTTPSFLSPPANPLLHDHASVQSGLSLKIRLNIGRDDGNEMRLPIDGLRIELEGSPLPKESKRPAIPGADGPNPNLSSGPMKLNLIQDGMFIDMNGLHEIGLKNGCWEMVWRKDVPAGSIICAFDHPEETKRNEHMAALPPGRIYLTFPVFPRLELKERQEKKAHIMKKAEKFLEEKDRQTQLMIETSNPLMKALHYRNACAAMEEYDYSGARSAAAIPDDNDVAPIMGDLVICLKGTVWTKDGSFLRGNHALLGVATVVPEPPAKASTH